MRDGQFKKWVPKAIKRPIKEALLKRQLNRAISDIARLQDGQVPGRDLLSSLIVGWSNDGFGANIDYLEEVARKTLETPGHILECGSGVTTILMGILGSKRKTQVWSMENSAQWRNRIMAVLKANEIFNVNVCHSPLIDYGDFTWYDPPLAKMPQSFSLVICDGPPGTTKGGRYGLLPIMRERFDPGMTILLDDAGRPQEADLIKKWGSSEARLDTQIIDRGGHVFAVMRFG